MVGRGSTTYVVSFPRILKLVDCPLPGCPEKAGSAGRMWEHFMYRHFRLKVVVLQEGRDSLPQCNMCGLHMPTGRLIKYHRTERCFNNIDMRLRRKDVEVTSPCAEMNFL